MTANDAQPREFWGGELVTHGDTKVPFFVAPLLLEPLPRYRKLRRLTANAPEDHQRSPPERLYRCGAADSKAARLAPEDLKLQTIRPIAKPLHLGAGPRFRIPLAKR